MRGCGCIWGWRQWWVAGKMEIPQATGCPYPILYRWGRALDLEFWCYQDPPGSPLIEIHGSCPVSKLIKIVVLPSLQLKEGYHFFFSSSVCLSLTFFQCKGPKFLFFFAPFSAHVRAYMGRMMRDETMFKFWFFTRGLRPIWTPGLCLNTQLFECMFYVEPQK